LDILDKGYFITINDYRYFGILLIFIIFLFVVSMFFDKVFFLFLIFIIFLFFNVIYSLWELTENGNISVGSTTILFYFINIQVVLGNQEIWDFLGENLLILDKLAEEFNVFFDKNIYNQQIMYDMIMSDILLRSILVDKVIVYRFFWDYILKSSDFLIIPNIGFNFDWIMFKINSFYFWRKVYGFLEFKVDKIFKIKRKRRVWSNEDYIKAYVDIGLFILILFFF
jgi:hypothetical protein